MKSMAPSTDRRQKPDHRSASSGRNLAAVELLSFLNQTRAVAPWTDRDLAKTLNIGMDEARAGARRHAIRRLYVASVGVTGKWRTTPQGESVSGSKPPRVTRDRVDKALSDLREGIRDTDSDPDALYKITGAVTFGDFLTDPARVRCCGLPVPGSMSLRLRELLSILLRPVGFPPSGTRMQRSKSSAITPRVFRLKRWATPRI